MEEGIVELKREGRYIMYAFIYKFISIILGREFFERNTVISYFKCKVSKIYFIY